MSTRPRFSTQLNAKATPEPLPGDNTTQKIGVRHKVHPNRAAAWKGRTMEDLRGVSLPTRIHLNFSEILSKKGRPVTYTTDPHIITTQIRTTNRQPPNPRDPTAFLYLAAHLSISVILVFLLSSPRVAVGELPPVSTQPVETNRPVPAW